MACAEASIAGRQSKDSSTEALELLRFQRSCSCLGVYAWVALAALLGSAKLPCRNAKSTHTFMSVE